ncbi:MAG: hypothetical protein ACK2UW_13065 [Anaerolineales bacterium]
MKEMTAKEAGANLLPSKFLISAIILAVMLLIGFFAYRGAQKPEAPAGSPQMTTISQSALEENYGLRVQLLAVTGAGGLVDLRLQIADAEKARAFLDDPANFPALRVGNDVDLRVSEDIAEQGIQFENGKSIFVLYPNTQNALKPGDPVTIVFGDLQVEAIEAQ